MATYSYKVEYRHGSAEGVVTADSPSDARAKARDLYDGLKFDTQDAKGRPIVQTTEVINVTVKEVKE